MNNQHIHSVKPIMCSHQLFARRIMSMLDLAGIDTKTFKAHPVRSATASAAASAGITTN